MRTGNVIALFLGTLLMAPWLTTPSVTPRERRPKSSDRIW